MSGIPKSFSVVENEQKRKGHPQAMCGPAHTVMAGWGEGHFEMKFPRRSFGSLPSPPPRPGHYCTYSLYCLLHETAVLTRSRPGSYELRSAPWYAYMHVHVHVLCMHAYVPVVLHTVVRRSLAMEGRRVKKRSAPPRFSFRVSVGPPIPPFIRQYVSQPCMHARIASFTSMVSALRNSGQILVFLFWNPWRARGRAVLNLYYAHFYSLSLKPDAYCRKHPLESGKFGYRKSSTAPPHASRAVM